MERNYYLVDPNGKSMEAISEWQRMKIEAIDAAYTLAEEYGADSVWRAGERIVGFHFSSHPGRWWKPVPDLEGVYYPDRRSTAGKTIAKRIGALRIPGVNTFADIIGGGHFICLSDGRVTSIGFKEIGGRYVISMPKCDAHVGNEAGFIPPDTTLLKPSEYYALKGE